MYETSFIYVASNGTPDVLKIGRSRRPQDRRIQIGKNANILYKIEMPYWDAAIVERNAHFLLGSRRIQGEWFGVTLQEAINAIDAATKEKDNGVKHPAFETRHGPNVKNIGFIIRSELESQGQSQKYLSTLLGISQNFMGEIIRDERGMPFRLIAKLPDEIRARIIRAEQQRLLSLALKLEQQYGADVRTQSRVTVELERLQKFLN